jgi:glycosyltransferase involved in cell wall biosynthesis
MDLSAYDIAAIVPCHNEALSVAKVVADLKAAVPGITVYVYDNLSTDGTDDIARAAGALVRYERTKGKGNVIRRAFSDIDADIYLMIDGDDTYDAGAAPELIRVLLEGPHDHVLGVRRETTQTAYRSGHAAGNKAFNKLVSRVFGTPVSDMMSGYRAMSRRFVKSFPAVSREFEIETELTVHVASLRVPSAEVEIAFKDRAEGSESKLNTLSDGFKILNLILHLVRHERPIAFHGWIGAATILVAVALGTPVVVDYAQTGLVLRQPTALLASSLVILGVLVWVVGLVLDAITKMRSEAARLNYLRFSAPLQPPTDK